MKRRHFLAGALTTVVAGSGCISLGESGGTEPLSGSFDSPPESSYWQMTTVSSAERRTHPALAVSDDIYAASRTHLQRVSSTGDEKWAEAIRHEPADLTVADASIYYTGGGGMEGSPLLAAHGPTDGVERWWQEPEFTPSLVGATNDALFVGARLDDPASAGMPVTALAADSGEQRWQAETGMTRRGVVSHDFCLIHSHPATIVALSTNAGEERWSHTFDDDIERIHVVGDTLYVLSSQRVAAYQLPAGTEVWNKSIAEQESFASDGPDSADADTVYVGGRNGTIRAIDATSGERRWSRTPTSENDGTAVRGLACGHETVVVRKGSTVVGLHSSDGSERWRQVLSPLYDVLQPLLIDETLFLLHAPSHDELHVKTFDINSGQRQWQFTPGSADAHPRYVVGGDRLVLATESGELFGFSPA